MPKTIQPRPDGVTRFEIRGHEFAFAQFAENDEHGRVFARPEPDGGAPQVEIEGEDGRWVGVGQTGTERIRVFGFPRPVTLADHLEEARFLAALSKIPPEEFDDAMDRIIDAARVTS